MSMELKANKQSVTQTADLTGLHKRHLGEGVLLLEKYTFTIRYIENISYTETYGLHLNVLLELCRYTGCKIIFWRHPHVDFVVSYQLSYPMISTIESYMTCHPAILINSRHKKIIPSLATKPHGKNFKKVKIKPPKLMTTKWFFQDHFANTGLFTLKSAAADLRYSFLGCCNTNQLVTFYALNPSFYQNAGWGNETGGTKWYLPYNGCPVGSYTVTLYNGKDKTINIPVTNYASSISYEQGWFQPDLLQAIKIKSPTEYAVPVTAGRYNPTIDTGEGNAIWIKSVLNNKYDPPHSDLDVILQDRPLWLMFYGFVSWVQKKKNDPGFMEHNYVVIESKFIEPKKGPQSYWVPIDQNFYLGKAPFDEYLTTLSKKLWYPTLEHQQETINAIVESGPFIPKFDNLKLSTWELHSTYTFYFKWGGSQLPDHETADPSKQHDYTVPDKLQQAIQVTDPQRQKKESILHSWDFRRGLATKTAIKRMLQNLSTNASISSDSEEEVPQKKKRGNAVPILETQENKIQK